MKSVLTQESISSLIMYQAVKIMAMEDLIANLEHKLAGTEGKLARLQRQFDASNQTEIDWALGIMYEEFERIHAEEELPAWHYIQLSPMLAIVESENPFSAWDATMSTAIEGSSISQIVERGKGESPHEALINLAKKIEKWNTRQKSK